MNGINRVGQPVVCINENFKINASHLRALRAAGINRFPKLNEIFHVAYFMEHCEGIYIALKEIHLPHGEVQFSIKNFRPLEKKSKYITDMIAKYNKELV